MRISSAYSGRTRRRSVTSLSENRQLPRRSAPGIIAAEVHAMNEVATTFLTLGAVSYGGAGVLGMMQAEIQQKRGWLSKERFLEGLALSNLLPGPTAAQLGMFLGYARAGWMGALVAGVCFVVPGFVVMLTLTLLYTTFAAVSTLRGAFYGLAPVVLGIFAIAVYRLGRAAIKDAGQLAFAVASAIAMAFPQVGIVTVVLVAGSVAIMLYASRAWGAVLVAATLALARLLALTSGVAMPLALDSGTGLGALALFFVIVGAFTFGGGLAMLAFIEHHAVTSFHWLTAQQFLDGLALGQLTPGPVGLALEVADGAVRKMSVVPDANGRAHRREEEQSDDQTADRCGVVHDDGRGGDTRRGLRFSEAPPSRLVPCPPPHGTEGIEMNRPKNLLHHSVLLATAFLAVLVMGALPVRAQQTATSPSVSATEKPYLFEWVYKMKWDHANEF